MLAGDGDDGEAPVSNGRTTERVIRRVGEWTDLRPGGSRCFPAHTTPITCGVHVVDQRSCAGQRARGHHGGTLRSARKTAISVSVPA